MNTVNRCIALLLICVGLSAQLQGCGAVVVGGAAVGASVLHDRRSAETVLDDKKIEFQIRGKISEAASLAEHSSVGVTCYNKVVLLTGQAETPQVKEQLDQLAQNHEGVKRVLNEVAVMANPHLVDEGEDAYLTSKVKLALFDLDMPDFDPTRVKVVTEQNTVYLMGLLSAEEAQAVVEKVRYVRGVKRVVKIFEYIQPQP